MTRLRLTSARFVSGSVAPLPGIRDDLRCGRGSRNAAVGTGVHPSPVLPPDPAEQR